MRQGQVTALEWYSRDVTCRQCGKELQASSLGRHLADVHDIYQQAVVAEELLETRPPLLYTVHAMLYPGTLACPYPRCQGQLRDGWMMRRHFQDMHPLDLVKVPKEGRFDRCNRCKMQVHPAYPRHRLSKECQIGVERKHQRETAVASALALRQQFTVHGDVLERVEIFKYLGRLLSQDDDDTRATWARVGQVLRSENASPFAFARFYQAVVQAILLYGSKLWVLSPTAMERLEGFHIRCDYRMAKEHKPKQGPGGMWIYPQSEDVLKECGMKMMGEYVLIHRQTIAAYVATRPILDKCRWGE
jgi:hypothetical protein